GRGQERGGAMAEQSTRVEERPTTLDALGLLGWARLCVEQLAAHREEINALNVFPVPDSDTGTNLLHTMRAAVDEAEGEEAWTSEGGGTAGAREIAVALGHGAVHGARGNSGVILSQVLRAVGEAATFTVVDASTYRRALRTAVTLVDNAISDPVEGTVVTVLREAASGAVRSSAATLVEVARAAPGRPADARPGRDVPAEVPAAPADDHEPEAGTQYEVMYSLTHTDDARADELRSALRALGDSVVVVGDGGTGDRARWAVHV